MVYVDDMHLTPLGQFRGMRMCHMIADTDDELHAMADRIGVQRRWFQKPGTHGRHYDIASTKRALAVRCGAREITMKQAALMCARRRMVGELGDPATAVEWVRSARELV
jgi:hypothetical protein